jgi:hypothetical protein
MAAVDGELLTVNGETPETLAYPAPAEGIDLLWRGLREHLARLFTDITIADLITDAPSPRALSLLTALEGVKA